MDDLSNKQKKELAQVLYLSTNFTQSEIADKVGVSRRTMVRWSEEWKDLRLNYMQTREARIISTLEQLRELDEHIESRDQGARYATPKEADTRRKLTADLKVLEQEASVREIVDVSQGFLDFVRQMDLGKAKELSDLFDAYIKQRIQWVK